MLHQYLFFTGNVLQAEPVAMAGQACLVSVVHASVSVQQSLATSTDAAGQAAGRLVMQQGLAGVMTCQSQAGGRIDPRRGPLALCVSLHVWPRLDAMLVAKGRLAASGVTVDTRFVAFVGTKSCL